jgi:hypothetical protein
VKSLVFLLSFVLGTNEFTTPKPLLSVLKRNLRINPMAAAKTEGYH